MSDSQKPTSLETREVSTDARQMSPSVARNKEPILEVLRPHLQPGFSILEIASGTGEHGAHIMSEVEGLTWQPSDPSPEARASILAWRDHLGREDFRPPIALDVTAETWGKVEDEEFDGMLCINMIHISPFEATEAVIAGAGKRVRPGGFLYFYGPYKRNGEHTAPSNEAFDQSLKARDPRWGIRDMEVVENLALQAGFALEEVVAMPANNFSLLFRRKG